MEININNDTTIDVIKQHLYNSLENKYHRLYLNNLTGQLLNDVVLFVNKKGYMISKNLFIENDYIIELKK
jgi:hypothetical protein